MYLRTPKRYQAKRQRRHLLSMRWAWLWILTPLVALAGYVAYENRGELAPRVQDFLFSAADVARSGMETVTAPTPLPTANPADVITQGNRAWNSGAIEEAMRAYQQALDGVPNDTRIYYRYTLGLIMAGRNQEALAAAERTITANPFASDGWAIRALALTRNDRHPEAIASALQALALNERNARALAFMAEAYLDAGQVERARQTVTRALDADPESFEAYYASGLIKWLADYDFNGARADFEAALERAPNLPYIAIDLAWLEYNLQNYDDGLLLLQQVTDQNPQNLDALYALSFFYYSVYGNQEQALDYITRCTTASPNNIACLAYLGGIQVVRGETQAALETYRRLIAAGTTNPQHYLSAGRVYFSVGDCRSATPLFQQGYALEQARPTPNSDRLTQFEQFLADCQAPLLRPVNPTETPAANT